MPKPSMLSLIAILAALLFAVAAPAQTVNLTLVSGNGQLRCPTCGYGVFGFFEPLQVKATDGAGNPASHVTVTWAGPPNVILSDIQNDTDDNGMVQITILAGAPGTGTFNQSTITATAGSSTVTFTETQALNGVFYPSPVLVSPDAGTTYTGAAGTQGSPSILIHVANSNTVIPGVSVRLVDSRGGVAAMTCVTGAGADPGSLLTDANGDATCTPLFGSTVVSGQSVVALIGGVNSSVNNAGLPSGFWASPPFFVNVTPSQPGQISKVSGDGQSANPGQSLVSALKVKVTDAAGVATIAGASVIWTLTPVGMASLGAASTVTDANGLSQNTVLLAAGAAGQFQVKAAIAGAPTLSTTFTVTANATITSLTKVSGDPQTAVVSTAFALPLVVQVNGTNSQALANYPVAFAVSGPATLSATSVNTDNNGRAQITVTAAGAPGTVLVTATAGAFSQVFTLTVIPVGPRITSFTNGAQFYTTSDANHSALSPCGIGTAYGTGIAPTIQGAVSAPFWSGPSPYAPAGVRVWFNNTSQAPILSVSNVNGVESVTFQVPCDVTPGNNIPVKVQANGGTANVTVIVRAAGPGIIESNALQSDGVTRAVLLRPDGSWVTLENPARRGETIRMFATGLGATVPAVSGTNGLPPIGLDAVVRADLFVGVNNFGTPLIAKRLSPDIVGVYVVDFQVPVGTPQGSNIVLSLAANAIDGSPTQFSGGSKIPVQ